MDVQVAFFLPQLVQQLRGDDNGAVRQFLLDGAKSSRLFAHHLVCPALAYCPASSQLAEHHLQQCCSPLVSGRPDGRQALQPECTHMSALMRPDATLLQ